MKNWIAPLLLCTALSPWAWAAAPNENLLKTTEMEKTPFLETLKGLVSIESGSRDREGLDQISDLIFPTCPI